MVGMILAYHLILTDAPLDMILCEPLYPKCGNCITCVYIAYAIYLILYLKMDIAFAWTTEMVYGIFTLIFCYQYMKKGKWRQKKI